MIGFTGRVTMDNHGSREISTFRIETMAVYLVTISKKSETSTTPVLYFLEPCNISHIEEFTVILKTGSWNCNAINHTSKTLKNNIEKCLLFNPFT